MTARSTTPGCVAAVRLGIALAAASAALAIPARFASAQPDTTAPGIVYATRLVLTDKTIDLSETRLPRGAMIRYTVINRGSRPYALQIGMARTLPIPPHGRVLLRVNWLYRGRFVYRTLYRGQPAGPHGLVSVI